MKYLYVVLAALLVFSCSLFARRNSNLPDISNFITFNIELPEPLGSAAGTRVLIRVKNISDRSIRIDNPACFGKAVTPFIKDYSGAHLPTNIEKTQICTRTMVALSAGREYSVFFDYTLEQLFNLNRSGTFTLWFTYFGKVTDSNGNALANDKTITSNKINITMP